MTLGVFLIAPRFPGQTDAAALSRALAAVDAAEAAGLDEAWVAEHHFVPYGTCPDALTFAALALGRTRRLAVGTAVSVLSTVHPVALAERALLLDNLSDGRFRLGVGRGGPWVDLDVFGTGRDRFDRGFPESLDLLRAALTGPSVAGTPRFPFPEVPVVPAPRTRPHPPLTVAATSAAGVESAAARGLPLLLGLHLDDDGKRDLVRRYEEAGGPADAGHTSAVLVHVGDSRERAVAEVMGTAPGWLRDGLGAHRPLDPKDAPKRDPREYARLLCDIHPVGDGGYVAARLAAARARTGVSRVIAMVESTGDPDHAARTISALGALHTTW